MPWIHLSAWQLLFRELWVVAAVECVVDSRTVCSDTKTHSGESLENGEELNLDWV
jgi:hypothetical protein